jgi:hypothetical protein
MTPGKQTGSRLREKLGAGSWGAKSAKREERGAGNKEQGEDRGQRTERGKASTRATNWILTFLAEQATLRRGALSDCGSPVYSKKLANFRQRCA